MLQIVSTMATVRMDKVREAGARSPGMMFQLYVFTHRENTVRLIRGEPQSQPMGHGFCSIVATDLCLCRLI